MDNLRRKKSSRIYKKRGGNQYTTTSIVKTVIEIDAIDEIEVAERNELEKINNHPEETVSNGNLI